jgi:peptidoglycan/LPS O-acetylase OafA/YrhL
MSTSVGAVSELRPVEDGRVKTSRRITELDGLRGLAIFLVLLCHYIKNSVVGYGYWYSWGLFPLRLTWSGVDLFFVISGFLIGGILLDARESHDFYRTFYLRRFFRILPLYYFWLVLFVIGLAIAPPILRGTFNTSLPPWSYPLFLQNLFMSTRQTLGPQWLFITWSLAVEEQFYLLLPCMIRRLSRERLFAVVVVAILCSPVLRVLLAFTGNSTAQLALLPCRGDALGLGVLAALMLRQPTEWIYRYRSRLYWSLLILWLGTIYFALAKDAVVIAALRGSWLALFYTNILLLAVVRPTRAERLVFGNKLLIRLGTISYGVYLFHEGLRCVLHYLILHSTAEVYDWRSLGVTVLSAGVTITLAEMSWRLFERPLVHLSHQRYRYSPKLRYQDQPAVT